jgi:hypothetical protein
VRRRFQSRKVKLLVVGVVALAVAGGAFAFWTASGSGAGSATVGNALAVSIAAGVDHTPSVALFPGGSGDVTVRISNPNTFVVHVGALSVDTSQGTNGFSASPSGCNFDLPTPALAFAKQTNGGLGWDIPKKVGATNGFLDFDLPGSISMNTNAVNACQGATFTVYLQATPS